MMLFPFNYDLGESELRVKAGRWIVRRIAYRDVKDVSLPEKAWLHWHFGIVERWVNFSRSKCIVLQRHDTFCGFAKVFVINPPSRETFASELRAKMRGE